MCTGLSNCFGTGMWTMLRDLGEGLVLPALVSHLWECEVCAPSLWAPCGMERWEKYIFDGKKLECKG